MGINLAIMAYCFCSYGGNLASGMHAHAGSCDAVHSSRRIVDRLSATQQKRAAAEQLSTRENNRSTPHMYLYTRGVSVLQHTTYVHMLQLSAHCGVYAYSYTYVIARSIRIREI